MDPSSVHGKWSTKAEYNVSVRHRAIALGGLIPIEAQIAPLCSSTKVAKARFYLREVHTIEDHSGSTRMAYEGQRVVTEWPLKLTESEKLHSWQQCLHLPLAVRNCSPDVSIHDVTISHTLHFEATLVTNGVAVEVCLDTFGKSERVLIFARRRCPHRYICLFRPNYPSMVGACL